MKNQKIKITVILTFLTLLTNNSIYGYELDGGAHKFSIYGNSGLSTFRYKLPEGDIHNGNGSAFGVGYTFYLNKQLGIHTGAGMGMYRTRVKATEVKIVSPNLIDSEGDRFDMHTTLFDYNEIQKALFLDIPVMGICQKTIGIIPVYIMGGIKMGIPINSKYASSSTKLENASYYPEFDNWAKSQKFAGNGVFDDKKFDGNLNLGVSLMLALEAGSKIYARDNISLYIGAFFDCGLNNVLKDKEPFINYTAKDPSNFTANMFSISHRTNMMSAGIILRVNFNISIHPKLYRKNKNPTYDNNISPYGFPFQER